MTAEGDGFAVLIAAVGVAAITGFEVSKRKVARVDFDAAELWHLRRRENRHWPDEVGSTVLAASTQLRRLVLRRRLLGRQLIRRGLWTIRNGDAHALGAA